MGASLGSLCCVNGALVAAAAAALEGCMGEPLPGWDPARSGLDFVVGSSNDGRFSKGSGMTLRRSSTNDAAAAQRLVAAWMPLRPDGRKPCQQRR